MHVPTISQTTQTLTNHYFTLAMLIESLRQKYVRKGYRRISKLQLLDWKFQKGVPILNEKVLLLSVNIASSFLEVAEHA